MSPPSAYYAFFDLDGTLINDTSLFSFYEFYVRTVGSEALQCAWISSREELAQMRAQNCSREEQNAWFYRRHFEGMPIQHAKIAARGWFALKSSELGFFKNDVVNCLARHRRQGARIVMVTGSFIEVAHCVGEQLGVAHYLCAPLRVKKGFYSGQLTDQPMIGQGKAVAVQRFLAAQGVSAKDCYGYGDDSSDLPFLNLLGHPYTVDG